MGRRAWGPPPRRCPWRGPPPAGRPSRAGHRQRNACRETANAPPVVLDAPDDRGARSPPTYPTLWDIVSWVGWNSATLTQTDVLSRAHNYEHSCMHVVYPSSPCFLFSPTHPPTDPPMAFGHRSMNTRNAVLFLTGKKHSDETPEGAGPPSSGCCWAET